MLKFLKTGDKEKKLSKKAHSQVKQGRNITDFLSQTKEKDDGIIPLKSWWGVGAMVWNEPRMQGMKLEKD